MAKKRKKEGCEEFSSISKADMFKRIEARTGLPVPVISSSYEAILEEVIEIVSEGNNAVFTGFGTFSVRTSNRTYDINKNMIIDKEEGSQQYSLRFVASRAGTKRLREKIAEKESQIPD